jgi:hypothetical protein
VPSVRKNKNKMRRKGDTVMDGANGVWKLVGRLCGTGFAGSLFYNSHYRAYAAAIQSESELTRLWWFEDNPGRVYDKFQAFLEEYAGRGTAIGARTPESRAESMASAVVNMLEALEQTRERAWR